ncbi:acetylornithine deacetylase [Neorhizobium galegae]|uniref:acetylornithine deacetylase n=1 Tax=Neorhizobium galegae TaxID=399 RepID=UPI0006229F21|nr:acetylornithine deacetylase [Neorhizobium galegae]KAB1123198.1 acetylornithine deacetylase [Neorhizobium galegae]MCQ1807255.1 acetylornithine deacetylase [Neorhizobium galegae]CDZ58954.1 Acetylornithine deacetylase ArgE [Neorhizobium galegae bv. orientalis]
MTIASDITRQLGHLVSYPTVSAVSNLDLIKYVEDQTAPFGGRVRRFANPEGDKANVLISIGPDAPGGIIFSGHTDVVPTEGQAWTGDPWTLREANGRLIGRGATDMKGFLACCLAAVPGIAKKNLKKPIHLAFSYDEELGCTGVGSMAEWVGQSDLKPRLAVIGEATSMDMIAAHKGGLIGWCRIKGKPGHSSQPDRYVNAVMVAGDMIAEINRIREDMRNGPRFEGLDPPYSTTQVNVIHGGIAGNIVSEKCEFFWEMRLIPGQNTYDVLDRMKCFAAEKLEPAMKAIDPACGIVFDVQASIPGLKPNNDPALDAELLALLGRTEPRYVSYGTEAGIFQIAGVPSVVIGPGDIADAHQPDESVAISELEKCTAFLDQLGDSCC